jgi:hypothetical protein
VWLGRNATGSYRAIKLVYRRRFEADKPYEREFNGIREFEPISRSHPAQVDILHVGRNDETGCFYYVMELADDDSAERIPEVIESAADRAIAQREEKGSPGSTSGSSFSRVIHPDRYSLGKVFYEMATGRDRKEFPEPPAGIEEAKDHRAFLEFNEVILKACEESRDRRYQTSSDLVEDLKTLLAGKSVRWKRLISRATILSLKIGALVAVVAAVGFSAVKALHPAASKPAVFSEPRTVAMAFNITGPRQASLTDVDYIEMLSWRPGSLRGELTYFTYYYPNCHRSVFLNGDPMKYLLPVRPSKIASAPGEMDFWGVWAPGGQRFYFSSESHHNRSIHVFHADARQVDHQAVPDSLPFWSHDGSTMGWVDPESHFVWNVMELK